MHFILYSIHIILIMKCAMKKVIIFKASSVMVFGRDYINNSRTCKHAFQYFTIYSLLLESFPYKEKICRLIMIWLLPSVYMY